MILLQILNCLFESAIFFCNKLLRLYNFFYIFIFKGLTLSLDFEAYKYKAFFFSLNAFLKASSALLLI